LPLSNRRLPGSPRGHDPVDLSLILRNGSLTVATHSPFLLSMSYEIQFDANQRYHNVTDLCGDSIGINVYQLLVWRQGGSRGKEVGERK
jgi:hypothetical protein